MRSKDKRKTKHFLGLRFNFSGKRLNSVTGPHPFKFWKTVVWWEK